MYVIPANNINMKKFVLSIIIAAGGLATQTAHAQVGVNVGVRIGPLVINVHKPVAPAVVYDDFYYLPEVDAYYSVPEHCYYYNDGDNWVNAAYLPGAYRDYDWRTARRYEVRAQRPYANHDYYRNKFGGNRGNSWNNRGGNEQYANRGPQRNYDRNNNWNNRAPQRNDDRNNGWNDRGQQRNDDRNNNWNDRGGEGRDNNRGPQRGGGNRPFPDSPYDSNNAGRGGNNQPNRGNGGYRPDGNGYQQPGNERGNWNGRGQSGGDRGQGGGRVDNDSRQPGRGAGGRGNYGQPSNNSNDQGNDRGNNRGQSNERNTPSRQHFAGNIPQYYGRSQGLK
jgi:hypothetical protein